MKYLFQLCKILFTIIMINDNKQYYLSTMILSLPQLFIYVYPKQSVGCKITVGI